MLLFWLSHSSHLKKTALHRALLLEGRWPHLGITRELVRNAGPQAPLRPDESESAFFTSSPVSHVQVQARAARVTLGENSTRKAQFSVALS